MLGSNLGYDSMVSGSGTNCAGDGTTTGTCQMPSLGLNGSKTIYFSCQDTFGNKTADGGATSVTYTLTAFTGAKITIRGKVTISGPVRIK